MLWKVQTNIPLHSHISPCRPLNRIVLKQWVDKSSIRTSRKYSVLGCRCNTCSINTFVRIAIYFRYVYTGRTVVTPWRDDHKPSLNIPHNHSCCGYSHLVVTALQPISWISLVDCLANCLRLLQLFWSQQYEQDRNCDRHSFWFYSCYYAAMELKGYQACADVT